MPYGFAVIRPPGPDTRRRALARAARHWGTVTVVLRGRFATQWVAATLFVFSTNDPDGLLGALSRRPSPGKIETETADDFILTQATFISGATIVGLIPSGASLADITNVEVELYHVFPKDSDVGRTSGPPTFATAQVATRATPSSTQSTRCMPP